MQARVTSHLDSAAPMVAMYEVCFCGDTVTFHQGTCGEQGLIVLDLPKTHDQGKPFVGHWGTVSVRDIGDRSP